MRQGTGNFLYVTSSYLCQNPLWSDIGMAIHQEGPNPLRPYYIPPSIGLPTDTVAASSSGARVLGNKNNTPATYARDIFSDIDYSDYVSEGSQTKLDTIRKVLDQALYKYVSVLLAQPFEIAKTILQVHHHALGDGTIPLADVDQPRGHASRYSESPYPEVVILS